MINLVTGESSLDRIARSLGGQTVLKAIAPKIAELLNTSSSWQDKRAALLALSAIAEGTAKSIKARGPVYFSGFEVIFEF